MPDLFLSMSRLGRADLTCSLRMMLVMKGARKEKKGLGSLFLFEKSCRFVEIACSAQVVYVRNKSLTRKSRTIRTQ